MIASSRSLAAESRVVTDVSSNWAVLPTHSQRFLLECHPAGLRQTRTNAS